jgi:sugar O-acyltransferase (sialic acid O-acetyltransferase NeuD family)
MLIKHHLKKIAVIGYGGFAKEITYNLPKEIFDFHIHKKFILPNQPIKSIESIDFHRQ